MLLSAVSVLVVAQSSSEIPEGLMNNPVHNDPPVPLAARSKAWVCGRSLTEIVGFESHREHGCLSVMSVVCYQVEVSATD